MLNETSRLRLRLAMEQHPRLWRTALGMRDLLLRGPWAEALVAYYRWKGRGRKSMRLLSPTLFPDLDVARTVADLQSRGVAYGLKLPDAELDEVLAHFKTLTDEELDEYREVHLKCPAADRIARDERMVEVARQYLGVEPVLFRTVGWVRHPYVGEPCFHFDSADVKDLLIFFYLNDVDMDNHPHALIPGTQRKTLAQMIDRRLPDAQAQRDYGDRIEVITGPRGTGFFEDTTNYHKRMGGTKSRLSLVVTYTLQRQP